MWQRLTGIGAALGLTACAAVVSVDGARFPVTSDAFRAYLEAVFRAQNQTADALAFALEDLGPDQAAADGELNAMEARLLNECAEVNRLAVSRRDDSPMSRREALAAARTAPDCERAERAARQFLLTRD